MSISIRLSTLGNDHPYIAESYNNVATVYSAKDDFEKALEYHQKAMVIRIKTQGQYHPDVANT